MPRVEQHVAPQEVGAEPAADAVEAPGPGPALLKGAATHEVVAEDQELLAHDPFGAHGVPDSHEDDTALLP
eukprot:4041304-Lingulodinium_polyedra.AAC.1